MYLKTQGLVLRVTEYRDSDAMLTVLTKEQGLMSFKARGVRSRRSQLAGEGTLKVRTYERGVEDETLACGTGSVAAAVVASRVRFPQVRSIDVQVRGGLLNVAFDVVGGRFSDVRLTGPARRVYSGVFRPENF